MRQTPGNPWQNPLPGKTPGLPVARNRLAIWLRLPLAGAGRSPASASLSGAWPWGEA